MTWIKARRGLAVFVLGSLLGSPWCLAAGPKRFKQKEVTSWAETWTQVKGGLISLWNEYGCAVDPLGLCSASATQELSGSTESQEIGCSLDPYGRCAM
jgi:hypothetical protein